MGDEAEGVFEAVYPKGYVRYGLKRPPIQVGALPLKLRYTPDFVTSTGLIEVQGFGKDKTLRLKLEKYRALCQWSADWHVDLFLWDKTKKRWAIIALEDLEAALAGAEVDLYPEGKAYWKIKVDTLDCEWTDAAA